MMMQIHVATKIVWEALILFIKINDVMPKLNNQKQPRNLNSFPTNGTMQCKHKHKEEKPEINLDPQGFICQYIL